MSEPRYKRKRSLQESSVDISKMRVALDRVKALKQELEGIEETENEMEQVMKHIAALEDILSTSKKSVCLFICIQPYLTNLGILSGLLLFVDNELFGRVATLSTSAINEIDLLKTRILEIDEYVNMELEAGARMVLDALLLSLAKLSCSDAPHVRVAILPEMQLDSVDGITIKNPHMDYEVSLSGRVDYAILRYADRREYTRLFLHTPSSLDFIQFNKGQIFLVEAKCNQFQLMDYIPEAVAQALALATAAKYTETRFCLANGLAWMFLLLKKENERWVYYASSPWEIKRARFDSSDGNLRAIMWLVSEWLNPTTGEGLYELVKYEHTEL
ncbi:hypothetical protein BDW22DRAFT_1427977 [Trametopsis cervina]|nr:hypothetical protein BDW22DRAFT_1427977 [Trametopsis cervina]